MDNFSEIPSIETDHQCVRISIKPLETIVSHLTTSTDMSENSTTPIPSNRESDNNSSTASICSSRFDLSPTTLAFHKTQYSIKQKTSIIKLSLKSNPFRKQEEAKMIIDDVSGIFTTGLNAIMGLFLYHLNI